MKDCGQVVLYHVTASKACDERPCPSQRPAMYVSVSKSSLMTALTCPVFTRYTHSFSVVSRLHDANAVPFKIFSQPVIVFSAWNGHHPFPDLYSLELNVSSLIYRSSEFPKLLLNFFQALAISFPLLPPLLDFGRLCRRCCSVENEDRPNVEGVARIDHSQKLRERSPCV